MVRLNRIYTRTGDDGSTSLVSGPRRPKHDLRIEAYGAIDETNAAIGVARIYTRAISELNNILERAQNDLFDLGADLATPETPELDGKALRIVPNQIDRLEKEIDSLNMKLSPLTSFVLPGGTEAAAALHMARTICRRAERMMTALAEEEPVNINALKYINRLSDLLFVAARCANDGGVNDILWTPGQHR